jgi:site-specific recombinase XerD
MPAMGRKPTVNPNMPPRMRRRKQRSGVTYYYYDAGGKPRIEIPLGSDYLAAVKKWATLHQDEVPIADRPTLKDVWDKFVKERLYSLAASTQKDYQKCIKQILAYFNDPPLALDDTEPTHIRGYMDWRGKSAEVRANHERRLINLLWNCAREWGYTALANPCTGIKGFTETPRTVYIIDQIFDIVYEEADQPTKDTLDISYLTAQRPADVVKMYETDIRDGRLEVVQNKRDKKLKIRVTGQLQQVIDRIAKRKTNYKVRSLKLIVDEWGKPLSQRALWERFNKARQRAIEKHPKLKEKIEEYQWRDLRAKGGTDKAVKEKDIRTAQRLLGHSHVSQTETYVREIHGDEVDPTA